MLKLFALIILIFSALACDDTLTVQNVDDKIIPSSNVSFAAHIYPVFQAKCFSCHGNGVYEARLNLTNPSYFVDGRIVLPHYPENSLIMYRVRGNVAGFSPMPPPGTGVPLTLDQIKGLETWIKEGAKDN
jgi:cytochrome c5